MNERVYIPSGGPPEGAHGGGNERTNGHPSGGPPEGGSWFFCKRSKKKRGSRTGASSRLQTPRANADQLLHGALHLVTDDPPVAAGPRLPPRDQERGEGQERVRMVHLPNVAPRLGRSPTSQPKNSRSQPKYTSAHCPGLAREADDRTAGASGPRSRARGKASRVAYARLRSLICSRAWPMATTVPAAQPSQSAPPG